MDFAPTEHVENFLINRFTLTCNFLVCLFISISEVFVTVMLRYLNCSTVIKSKINTEKVTLSVFS